MKKALLLAVLLCSAGPALAQSVYVKPHLRTDGTYVQGHWRSSPNSTRLDNYSTYPNVNPHTGQSGTEPVYPRYPQLRTPQPPVFDPTPSPFSQSTQQRMRQNMPTYCSVSEIC